MTKDEVKQFVADNIEAIVEAACSFPFKEAVNAITEAAKKSGLRSEESLYNIARAAYNAAYVASEDLGVEKAMELAQNSGKFSTDSDEDYDALADAVLEELADIKLEPYVGDEYKQFQ